MGRLIALNDGSHGVDPTNAMFSPCRKVFLDIHPIYIQRDPCYDRSLSCLYFFFILFI